MRNTLARASARTTPAGLQRTATVALALATALAVPSALAHGGTADVATRIQSLRQSGEDPYAPVFIVAARDSYQRQMADLAHSPQALQDSASGTALIVAEVESWRLSDISGRIHEREQRCGGFFAFATRAEAEAFVHESNALKAQPRTQPLAYGIDNQTTVTPWLGQLVESNIRDTITYLSTTWPNRHRSTVHGTAAANWIRDTWLAQAAGRSDVSVQLHTTCSGCAPQPSVILTIAGNELPEEIVVLGGHLDSTVSGFSGTNTSAPGADDDASGIATLTEVLRIALASGWKPRRTVMFMGYAAEEAGLLGSKAIAQEFRNQNRNVVGVLQLDMTNYTNGNQQIQVMTDFADATLVQFYRELFATYVASASISLVDGTCGYGCSDHAAWTQYNYPAALVIEKPFFNRIHSINDTLANMGGNASHSLHFAKLGLAFLGEVAKTSDRLFADDFQ
ncbi:leucyl aminopeptidase [Tahibacter aquaticus]|uniref:Leucyl aminopeptidase n=1 Tax=Tahibacter aquaticus TaxID=520092 RepID=A0A4R6Z0D7_9GAMM|nr:M20/M25/M40 family metallo-hydrolase [Tahibacter aquaticus]TDR44977.1 leucyl aminopeptidase [Tahibacter aquaticus]